MSKTTIALEQAVAAVISSMTSEGQSTTARQRATLDRAFTQILKIIAPRIRHFIRQYGLVGHWDDAEQCCAIAVHRAIQTYDPDKAQFTTFVNWQIRGELQGLRFRLMVDQRPSARKVAATTVSMHGITSNVDGEEMTLESIIEDEGALARTEAAASDYLAGAATTALLDAFIADARSGAIEQLRKRPSPKRPPADPAQRAEHAVRRLTGHGIDAGEIASLDERLARDRDIVERRVFGMACANDADDCHVTKDRVRQITKRAASAMAVLTQSDPRFKLMAN